MWYVWPLDANPYIVINDVTTVAWLCAWPRFKDNLTWYTTNIIALRASSKAVYTLMSQPGTHPKPTQPWCEYYLVWAITSCWWDQVSALHPIQGWCHPVLPHRVAIILHLGEVFSSNEMASHLHSQPMNVLSSV